MRPTRRWTSGWLALAAAVLGCKDALRPDGTGSIAIRVELGAEAASGLAGSPGDVATHLTAARATATSGSTTRTAQLSGGASGFSGTISDVPAGTYAVAVEGLVGTEVDYFGQQASLAVASGQTATATITFSSFVPTLSAVTTPTASFRPSLSFSSVSNATSYLIEVARNSAFTGSTSTTVTTASGSVSVSDTGTHYVRIRAANTRVAQGGRPSGTQTFRVVTDQRVSGDAFATATNLGFGSAASVTLDSLNIFPAADSDWFQMGECNGDSLTVTAQAVRLSPASPLNTVLQLYSGATGRLMASSDDADSTDARVRVQLIADTTYKVRVSGTGNTVGHYKLAVQVKTGANNQGTSCRVQPLAVTSISSGAYHTCATRATGVVDCWGYNLVGSLGNGTTTTTTSPTRVSGTQTYQAVTAGALHACGLTTAGAAYCWGYNLSGQLGNGASGSAANSLTPVAVLGALTFQQLSAGDWHTCGLTTGSQIYCWGLGGSGQLGNSATTDRSQPGLVSGGLLFQSVSAGASHTCGLTTGGSGYCWGLNSSGQLGNSSTTNTSAPALVSGGLTFASIGAGGFHTCARTGGGGLYCWGQNDLGQLGDGTTTTVSAPTAVSGGFLFSAIEAGRFHTCGLVSSVAYCWGNNFDGQVGDGTNTLRLGPTAVSTANTFTSISGGGWHTCAVRSTTTEAYCWGWNGVGQIGDGSGLENTGPVAVSGSLTLNNITTGHQHTCGATSTSVGYCWGWNFHGQLGDGTTTDRLTPALVSGGLLFTSIVGGAQHSCGLLSSGAAYCWGDNSSGQLGNGGLSPSSVPVLVTGGFLFAQVSAGDLHTCGRTTAGAILCWGENGQGQLGNGGTTDSPTPVSPSLAGTFRWVSAGGDITCAVTTTNAAYCWGNNQSGSLGNGTTTNSLVPVAVSGSLSFNTIFAGLRHACGITTGNEAYCWGLNNAGQLGIGSNSNATTPTRVSGGFTWKAISASRNENTCGITFTDVLYCWGLGFFGQLGDGGITSVNSPKAVLTSLAFKDVQSGDAHTCGLTTSNQPYCWGNNERGELGNGRTTTRTTPVAVLTGPASVPPLASASDEMSVAEAREMLLRSSPSHRAELPHGGRRQR